MSTSDAVSPPRLRAQALTVRRGERLLFSKLDFEVAPGEVLLLRGPNGAGKSTLLQTLAGIARPESGTVAYGSDPEDLRVALHMLSHLSGIKARLTALENIAFWRGVNGATGLAPRDALDAVGIGHVADLEAGYLSAGQTKRLALARLLVSERRIWLLDEPSSALDAAGEALLGRLIDDHRQRGGITVIATHYDLPISDRAGVHTLRLGQ